jgi:hypothetical protein
MRAEHLKSVGGLLICSFLLFQSVDAYELRTHGSITDQSFTASQGIAQYLGEIDIGLGDIFDPQSITRPDQLMHFTNDGTVRGWMVEGSIREDDYQPHPRLESLFGCETPRNPPSLIDRSLNHFFDVQRGGAGLTLGNGLPAPDWALGLQGHGPSPDQNQFSLPDARVYQARSLTESSPSERDRSTAKLFRTLGQVIHVLQDMAQPQHTRNDPHLGCVSGVLQFVAGERSWYEKYTETRALSMRYRTRSDASRPLVLSGYGPAAFQGYRDYWANASGSGLAEFSSRNFFSAATNLGTFYLNGPCGGLSQPVCDPQAYTTQDTNFTIPTLSGETLSGRVRFFLSDINDPLSGLVVPNVRVSSRSLWDQHLETSQRRPRFSLNTFNYDSIADVLLPRAVGYSAGLLDYFFRGKLDVDLVADPDDSSKLKLVGKLLRSNGPPNEDVAGTLALYWDDADGVRRPVPDFVPMSLAGVTGDPIASPPFPKPQGAARFAAVYQGTLGQEQDAVVGKVGAGGGGVEELFIDDATGDLYFRNRTLLTRLHVVERLTPAGAYIDRVIWGNDGVSFMVRVGFGSAWAIFELSPRPATNMTWRTAPTAVLVRQETFAALGDDEVFTIVLDSRRDILYGGDRGREMDPYNYRAAVLVNQSRRTTLRDYGIAILGEFGGGSVPYIVYADGADLAGSVVVVKSFAYLDHNAWGYAPTPFRTALWVGSSERILHRDTFGAPRNHELDEDFGGSDDPVRPHSTRQHVLYSVLFRENADRSSETTVRRVFLHHVKTGVSRIVAEDSGFYPYPYPTPHLELVSKYDLRGSANTGVDRLFQALQDNALPEDEREQFFVAWDRVTGEPLLDVTAANYPAIDTAARDLARLIALPAELAPRWSPVGSRAIQVVE